MAFRLSHILEVVAARSSTPSSPSSSLLRGCARFPPLRNLSTTVDSPQTQAASASAADEVQSPPATEPAASDGSDASSVDSVLRNTFAGAVYAKLTGTGRSTLKTDVMHLLEDCKLTPEDIKVEYNRVYAPLSMILQFHSRSALDTAIREVARQGPLYRLEKVDRNQWDLQDTFNGKSVLLQGIPLNASVEDIERFLSGCNFDASDFKFLMRPGASEPIRMALVRFPSQNEALHAFRVKNRGFCLNNIITMRILQ